MGDTLANAPMRLQLVNNGLQPSHIIGALTPLWYLRPGGKGSGSSWHGNQPCGEIWAWQHKQPWGD
ncbi:MAG: hypothetical protein JJU11_04360 [Candidatus Sumerlaeia bacterium]|nr:hypothetical protein [Candidatus Sumerlaeia bacterium]